MEAMALLLIMTVQYPVIGAMLAAKFWYRLNEVFHAINVRVIDWADGEPTKPLPAAKGPLHLHIPMLPSLANATTHGGAAAENPDDPASVAAAAAARAGMPKRKLDPLRHRPLWIRSLAAVAMAVAKLFCLAVYLAACMLVVPLLDLFMLCQEVLTAFQLDAHSQEDLNAAQNFLLQYKTVRVPSECLLESMPQSFLQLWLYFKIQDANPGGFAITSETLAQSIGASGANMIKNLWELYIAKRLSGFSVAEYAKGVVAFEGAAILPFRWTGRTVAPRLLLAGDYHLLGHAQKMKLLHTGLAHPNLLVSSAGAHELSLVLEQQGTETGASKTKDNSNNDGNDANAVERFGAGREPSRVLALASRYNSRVHSRTGLGWAQLPQAQAQRLQQDSANAVQSSSYEPSRPPSRSAQSSGRIVPITGDEDGDGGATGGDRSSAAAPAGFKQQQRVSWPPQPAQRDSGHPSGSGCEDAGRDPDGDAHNDEALADGDDGSNDLTVQRFGAAVPATSWHSLGWLAKNLPAAIDDAGEKVKAEVHVHVADIDGLPYRDDPRFVSEAKGARLLEGARDALLTFAVRHHAWKHLKSLALVNCGLTANHLKPLVALLIAHKQLQRLDLSHNPLGDSGMTDLAEGLVNNRGGLQELALCGVCCGPRGAGVLCGDMGLQLHNSLQVFDLSCNLIEDAGVNAVCQLVSALSTLTTLRLEAVDMSREAAQQLLQAVAAGPATAAADAGTERGGTGAPGNGDGRRIQDTQPAGGLAFLDLSHNPRVFGAHRQRSMPGATSIHHIHTLRTTPHPAQTTQPLDGRMDASEQVEVLVPHGGGKLGEVQAEQQLNGTGFSALKSASHQPSPLSHLTNGRVQLSALVLACCGLAGSDNSDSAYLLATDAPPLSSQQHTARLQRGSGSGATASSAIPAHLNRPSLQGWTQQLPAWGPDAQWRIGPGLHGVLDVVRSCTALVRLDLSENPLRHTGGVALAAALAGSPTIRSTLMELQLRQCGLDAAAVQALCGALVTPQAPAATAAQGAPLREDAMLPGTPGAAAAPGVASVVGVVEKAARMVAATAAEGSSSGAAAVAAPSGAAAAKPPLHPGTQLTRGSQAASDGRGGSGRYGGDGSIGASYKSRVSVMAIPDSGPSGASGRNSARLVAWGSDQQALIRADSAGSSARSSMCGGQSSDDESAWGPNHGGHHRPTCALLALDLSDNPLGNQGWSYVGDLMKRYGGLQMLNLSKTGAGVAAVETLCGDVLLAPGRHYTALRDLDLSFTPMGDAGVAAVAEVLRAGCASAAATGMARQGSASAPEKTAAAAIPDGIPTAGSFAAGKIAPGASRMRKPGSISLRRLSLRACNVGSDGYASLQSALVVNRCLVHLELADNLITEIDVDLEDSASDDSSQRGAGGALTAAGVGSAKVRGQTTSFTAQKDVGAASSSNLAGVSAAGLTARAGSRRAQKQSEAAMALGLEKQVSVSSFRQLLQCNPSLSVVDLQNNCLSRELCRQLVDAVATERCKDREGAHVVRHLLL